MRLTGSRLRQIGWGFVLGLCLAVFVVLSITVHATRSELVLADKKIVRLEKAKQRLETEFQARASQHQLARWNNVDLGYTAPRADQYLEARRDLAKLGQPLGPGTPTPIRVARAEIGGGSSEIADTPRKMVSPVSGRTVTLAALDSQDDTATSFAEAFGDFLVEASPIREASAQTLPVTRDLQTENAE